MPLAGNGQGRKGIMMDERMTVVVVKRDGWNVQTVTVNISKVCPVCGGPRGIPTWQTFCEDGEWLSVNIWTNDCGHVDLYKDVLTEAGIEEKAL